jgi:hypothetical protein
LPVNTYLTQRLAFTTYKAKEPDKVSALRKAITILNVLDLKNTNDTETVVLAGRIEKKLFLNGKGDSHLERAIEYHERAYFLLNSRYNGINLAFLLNNRVGSGLYNTDQDRITDMVLANRMRRNVLKICEWDWKRIAGASTVSEEDMDNSKPALSLICEVIDDNGKFWILINKAEAHYGLGEFAEYNKALASAKAVAHEEYKMKRFENQRIKLQQLLVKYGSLLTPAWMEKES